MLIAAVSSSVTETASYVIVRDSVFGALLFLAVGALIALTRILLTVQDKRIADLQTINRHVEYREEKNGQLIVKMTDALSSHTKALEVLERSYLEHTRVIKDSTDRVLRLEGTVDSVIRDYARAAATARTSSSSASEPRGVEYPPRAEYSRQPRGGG
jgi:hypothetical protein